MKKVSIFLAEGFEEVEALTPADVLRQSRRGSYTGGRGRKARSGRKSWNYHYSGPPV